MNRLSVFKAVLGTLLLSGFAAHAQQKPGDFPNKPLRIYVASAPGGGVDVIVRVVAQKLTERWGTSVVVDNVAGGVGLIALERMLTAPPDGHTFISSGSAIEMHTVYKRVDTLRTLMPVVQMTTQPYLLAVTSSLPVNSVKEYAAYAKARPGQINYASSGIGGPGHLGHEMFNAALGITTTHVPYKGAGSAIADLTGGRIQLMFISTLSGMPLVRRGAVKAIAMTGLRRLSSLPDVPTISESGIPGFEMNNGYGIHTNIKSPLPAIMAMNKEVMAIMHLPDMKSKLDADGAEAEAPHTPQELRDRVEKRIQKWTAFVEKTGIKPE
jgi:tripartite-type tricarboxylate transporter receptor subunit TctC